MKSPFAIFRKHQKVLMALLTGLAMFAFVVMDNLRSDRSSMSMPILLGVLLMAVFGFVGWRSGQGVKYGVVGAVAGIALGLVIHQFINVGPSAAVETAMGNLSQEDMNGLIARRHNANNFMRLAFEKVVPPPRDDSNGFLAQLYEQQLNQRMFGFGRERDDLPGDVLLGYLLDKEADELGIVVSDAAVSDYINQMTDKKLTPNDFNGIVKSLRLSESQVFDAIRGELRAKLAIEMLVPRATPLPEQYWEDYRKLHVTQTLDVAGIAIADLISEAPQPNEDQLTQYFNANKDVPPAYPGAPGLRQPRRVRIEYLEADAGAIEKEIEAKPITDEEVQKYYQEHRENYRNRAPASGSPGVPPGPALPLPAPARTEPPAAAPKGGTTAPGAQPPASSKPVSEQPATAKPTAPKSTGPIKEPAKKDAGKSGARLDRRIQKMPVDGELWAAADWKSEPIQLADAQSAPPKGSSASTAKPAAKDSASAKANSKPSASTAATGPKKESSRPANADPFASEATPKLGGEPGPPPAPEGPQSSAELPEFKPLDSLLQREIRDQILRGRVQEAMKAKIQAAVDYMMSLREQLIPADVDSAPQMSSKDRAKALAEYAAAHKLKYVLTPPLSSQELHDSPDQYPIARAAEPMEDPFQRRQAIDVIQQLFLTPPEHVFQPYQADDRDSHRFAYWKVEDVADHTPTLDEPGVREQAIRGWKIKTFAQKKAQERADELAELVRKSKQPMVEALAGQTVTKKPNGPPVLVVSTPPFSWITVQSAAPRDLMADQMPRLSEIAGVKDVDNEFMKVVFQQMQLNDVRVIPNLGPSVYYVVRLKSRHPADSAEMEAFRSRFLKTELFGTNSIFGGRTTYEYMNMPDQQQLVNTWVERLYAKYNVRRNFQEERRPRPRRAAVY